jgi:VPDSG-CTERM motif
MAVAVSDRTGETIRTQRGSKMKKLLTAIACTLALGLSATTAQALTIGDNRYLGSIVPGVPTNPTSEVSYINQLITMGLGTSTVIAPNTFTRSSRPCPSLGGCPTATLVDASVDQAPPGGPINVTGYEWLYAKYGGDSHVWWIGGLGAGVIIPPSNGTNNDLSHYALFNATGRTPDGGATLGLLGLGVLALGYLRRRVA